MRKIVRNCVSAALLLAAPVSARALCAAGTVVNGNVTATGPGVWTYYFSVLNGCVPNHQPLMTDFFLPYFSDAGLSNFVLPPEDDQTFNGSVVWTYSIDPNDDLFGLPDAGVIDYHVTVTPPFEVLPDQTEPGVPYYGASGFSFTADYGAIEGPYAIQLIPYDDGNYVGTQYVFGDPPIPASPLAIAALGATTATPEPSTLTLLATGCLVMGAGAVRRRKRV
ncbi:MAG TPA: PEP-CTERM sorting domain-containing protein [Gemmatimonadaceae bacterium]|jgi:hypothetical protein|nr:PEP-CTERM sorting domain-containing protein [Gemmatimonadaceae bacterium]